MLGTCWYIATAPTILAAVWVAARVRCCKVSASTSSGPRPTQAAGAGSNHLEAFVATWKIVVVTSSLSSAHGSLLRRVKCLQRHQVVKPGQCGCLEASQGQICAHESNQELAQGGHLAVALQGYHQLGIVNQHAANAQIKTRKDIACRARLVLGELVVILHV
ncbi:hypothetical protein ON010_g2900 [Phytophthora cinnamomi]|nr:hypothetical protein ON010_g2900 [Phytophthora cinnamomi]